MEAKLVWWATAGPPNIWEGIDILFDPVGKLAQVLFSKRPIVQEIDRSVAKCNLNEGTNNRQSQSPMWSINYNPNMLINQAIKEIIECNCVADRPYFDILDVCINWIHLP